MTVQIVFKFIFSPFFSGVVLPYGTYIHTVDYAGIIPGSSMVVQSMYVPPS